MGKSNAERQAEWRARQQSEVEQLRRANEAQRVEITALHAKVAELQAEIQRLRPLRNDRPSPPPLPDELPPRVKRARQPHPETEPKPKPKRTPHYQFPLLRLFQATSEARVHVAYRAVVKTYHPDVGGSHAAMTQLNRERDRALKIGRHRDRERKARAGGWSMAARLARFF